LNLAGALADAACAAGRGSAPALRFAGATIAYRELVALCDAGLPRNTRPHWIELVLELPKTATGKIQRFRLRERERARASEIALGRTRP
jgi:benzoate-CoA ligase